MACIVMPQFKLIIRQHLLKYCAQFWLSYLKKDFTELKKAQKNSSQNNQRAGTPSLRVDAKAFRDFEFKLV